MNHENTERTQEEEIVLLEKVISHLKESTKEHTCPCESVEIQELLAFVKTQKRLNEERAEFYSQIKKDILKYLLYSTLTYLGIRFAPDLFKPPTP